MLKRFKGTKGMILLIIIVLLVVGYYYYLSHRTVSKQEETSSEILTPVQQVLLRDLETNYPQTPREVVKYFSEITQCLYNEELTEEDIKALGLKIRGLYDDELIATQTETEYLDALQKDVAESRINKQKILNYTPSSTVDVDTYTENGYDWAKLYCNYGIQQNGLLYNSNTVFMLRKDVDGHYKIVGWDLLKKTDS